MSVQSMPEELEDSLALSLFTGEMADRLEEKRAQGYAGWHDPTRCPPGRLAHLFREAVKSGKHVDVANYAMMLRARDEAIEPDYRALVMEDYGLAMVRFEKADSLFKILDEDGDFGEEYEMAKADREATRIAVADARRTALTFPDQEDA